MVNAPGIDDKCARAKAERDLHVGKVLQSKARKKVVVAGPGTGKTYLFKTILKDKPNSLTLTFVNALVEDLSLELNGLSQVRTLHGFARNLLKQLTSGEIGIAPKLPEVIKEDAALLLNEDIDFNKLFYNRDDENRHLAFYQKRKAYYGDKFGYSDVIFAAAEYLEAHRNEVPAYEQIVVDEFQDFNRLEVSLIELLSEKSPVLIAGDDDQALYAFKDASPEHIRIRHDDRRHGYEAFSLPFCSRCTRVIVDAANDIIAGATKLNLLKGRITKAYTYFEEKEKNEVSSDNPTMAYSQLFPTQIPWFIEQRIGEIARELKSQFSVLVIAPTKTQCRIIANALAKKGFERIEFVDRSNTKAPALLDGLKMLLENDKDNLGWRIVARCLLEGNTFKALLRASDADKAKSIRDMVDKDCKSQVKAMLAVLRRLANNLPIDDESLQTLKKLDLDPYKIMRDILREDMDLEDREFGNPATRKIPIKATTIESSKGLAEDYVFITYFDDLYFIKDAEKRATDKCVGSA